MGVFVRGVLCTRSARVIWIVRPFWLGLEPGQKLALLLGLLFLYRLFMAKSISRTEKRSRGRPATNPTSIHLTLAPSPLADVDRWIEKQKEPDLTRPEAIRRLVELGLTVGGKPKQTTAATADRAKELASKAIDSLTAGAPNKDEKASRKRRLIKGPEEFREVRVDRPKGKS